MGPTVSVLKKPIPVDLSLSLSLKSEDPIGANGIDIL